MKKILILSALALTSLAASAQELPARPYFEAGKEDFKKYDDALGKRQFGMFKADDPKTPEIFYGMAKDLVSGYDNYIKALSLDTVVNEKGKVKTKYSKDIISTLVGHYHDFNTAAVDFWEAKDFDGAYRAWDIFLKYPENPKIAKDLKVPADSLLCEVMYNQALAAWQANNLPNAIKSFRNAAEHGYNKEQLFTYGASVANEAKDLDNLKYFATKGSQLFPKNDNFVSLLINYYLGEKNYDGALQYLDEAIAGNPSNAQFITLKGIIFDNQGNAEEAMKEYEKALSINPENAIANLYYGLGLNARAGKLSDNYTGSNFDKYKAETINPIFRDAEKHLRKAYDLDKNIRSECLKVLELVYYNLDDAAGQEWVKQARLKDE